MAVDKPEEDNGLLPDGSRLDARRGQLDIQTG